MNLRRKFVAVAAAGLIAAGATAGSASAQVLNSDVKVTAVQVDPNVKARVTPLATLYPRSSSCVILGPNQVFSVTVYWFFIEPGDYSRIDHVNYQNGGTPVTIHSELWLNSPTGFVDQFKTSQILITRPYSIWRLAPTDTSVGRNNFVRTKFTGPTGGSCLADVSDGR